MNPQHNAGYFSHPATVLEYARAVGTVGLWESEKILCEKFFPANASILELGCGAGRIAFGLWAAGRRDITATDFSPAMVETAGAINETQNTGIRFEVADATDLPYPENTYDCAIFGFNGLLMIPVPARREAALREIRRVLKPGGVFIFTGHDRNTGKNAGHWDAERERWMTGKQDPSLDAFGDYNHATPAGRMFIHAADSGELAALLKSCEFELILSEMRSAIASESPAVREFSDDTRFWVVRKPA